MKKEYWENALISLIVIFIGILTMLFVFWISKRFIEPKTTICIQKEAQDFKLGDKVMFQDKEFKVSDLEMDDYYNKWIIELEK